MIDVLPIPATPIYMDCKESEQRSERLTLDYKSLVQRFNSFKLKEIESENNNSTIELIKDAMNKISIIWIIASLVLATRF